MTRQNALAHETSPYLLQHKDNPVHWQAWGPEAFAAAKAEGRKAVLLRVKSDDGVRFVALPTKAAS